MRSLLAPRLVIAACSLTVQPRVTRRSLGGLLVAFPTSALAADLKKDCIKDCVSNCNRVAPGNKAYCAVQCEDYCAQDDRKDSSEGN